jgi:hypothetical protein
MNFKGTFQSKGRIYIFYIPASHGITKADTKIQLIRKSTFTVVSVPEYLVFGGIFLLPWKALSQFNFLSVNTSCFKLFTNTTIVTDALKM